jgi:hypothetical protein
VDETDRSESEKEEATIPLLTTKLHIPRARPHLLARPLVLHSAVDTTTTLILLLIATLLIHLAEEIKTGFRKRLPEDT